MKLAKGVFLSLLAFAALASASALSARDLPNIPPHVVSDLPNIPPHVTSDLPNIPPHVTNDLPNIPPH